LLFAPAVLMLLLVQLGAAPPVPVFW